MEGSKDGSLPESVRFMEIYVPVCTIMTKHRRALLPRHGRLLCHRVLFPCDGGEVCGCCADLLEVVCMSVLKKMNDVEVEKCLLASCFSDV